MRDYFYLRRQIKITRIKFESIKCIKATKQFSLYRENCYELLGKKTCTKKLVFKTTSMNFLETFYTK